MAHFVKLSDTNVVIDGIVISNEALEPANEEASGQTFIQKLFNDGATWLQTSYNGSIRYNYAGLDFTYDPIDDAFIAPMPNCGHDSLLLNDEKKWECESCAAEAMQSRTTA